MSDTRKTTKPNVPNLRFPGFEGEWELKNSLHTYMRTKKGTETANLTNLTCYLFLEIVG